MEYKEIFGYDDWLVELFSEVSEHRRFFYFILLNSYFLGKILPSRITTSKGRRIDVDTTLSSCIDVNTMSLPLCTCWVKFYKEEICFLFRNFVRSYKNVIVKVKVK